MPRKQQVEFVISAKDKASRVLERVRKGILRVGRAAKSIGKGLGAAVGLFGLLAKRALSFATSFEAAARRVDASSETLQGLKVLGDDIGVSLDTTVAVMQKLQSQAGAAIGGNEPLIEHFDRLGISVEELKQLDGEGLLLRVADATKNFAGDSKVLQDTLRKVGDTEIVRLIPLLEQGSQAIQSQIKGLKDAGALLSNEQTKAAAEKEAKIRREILVLQTKLNDQVLELLPPLIKAASFLASIVQGAGKFIGESAAKTAIFAKGLNERAVNKVQELRGRAGVDGAAAERIAAQALADRNPGSGLQGRVDEGESAQILKEINKNIQQQTREMSGGWTLR